MGCGTEIGYGAMGAGRGGERGNNLTKVCCRSWRLYTIYGGSATIYRGSATIYGGSATIYGGSATIYGGNAVFGR
eukprot:2649500-Rhodomonas_salina.1